MDRAERFQQVIEQHKNRVYTEAYYSLYSVEDAEDVTQEVFVRLWKNWSTIDFDRVGGWLVRVTRNLCIDTIRKRRSQPVLQLSGEEREDLLDGIASEEVDVRDQLLASEEEMRIKTSIASLEEPYKSAVILREIQDLTYEEIAESLGVPIGSVKVHLHRGRKMLRELLRKEMSVNEA